MNERLSRYLARHRNITEGELREFFEPYRKAFPEWLVEHDVALTRVSGPLKQKIWLEAVSDSYRLGHAVNLFLNIPGSCSLLHQHLDVRHRRVSRQEHSTKWPMVLKAMEGQFTPSIRQPLDVAGTLRLAEEEAQRDRIDNINYSTGLAALNAYLGNAERALYWCGRIEETTTHLGRPLRDWEISKRRYALDLQQAIREGKVREFFS